MRNKTHYIASITDRDGEAHSYYFFAESVWIITNYILAEMNMRRDFYGHKKYDTVSLEIDEVLSVPAEANVININ